MAKRELAVSLLSRLFGYASRDEADGARLADPHPWVVPPSRDAGAMLRALPILLPRGGFVYFEGTTEAAFESWARAHAVSVQLKIAYGTIWPKPDWFHVPLDPALMQEAAGLIERNGIALPSIHIHVHDGVTVLLEWHDAFVDDPMYVSSAIPREAVEAFASSMNVGPVSRGDHAI